MTQRSVEPASPGRSDRSRWYWLLIVPVVVPLLTSVYNVDQPRLLDIPAFYWLQLAFILLGVATTALVYRMTTPRRGGPDA